MNLDEGLENSKHNLFEKKDRIPDGMITRGFFNIDDEDDVNYQSAQSPDFKKKKQQSEAEQKSTQNPMKNKKGNNHMKLKPFKEMGQHKVQIVDLESEQSSSPTKLNNKNKKIVFDSDDDEGEGDEGEGDEGDEGDEDEKVEKIVLESNKTINKKQKLLMINESQFLEEPPNERKLQKSSNSEEEEGNQAVTVLQENLSEVSKTVKIGEEIPFLIRRDKQWFNKLRPHFNIHFQSNNQYFFSAKLTSSNSSTTFIISKSRSDFKENGPNYIGKIKGNFMGNIINIYGTGFNPSDSKERGLPLRELLATVEYETNFFGTTRPRNFKVFIKKPEINYYSLNGTKKWEEQVPLNELYPLSGNENKIIILHNKKPEWNEQIKGYMLNFGGKVKKASIKNFILEDENNPQNAKMIFGKVNNDEYRMDVSHPLSPHIAIGIALSSFGYKIGCE